MKLGTAGFPGIFTGFGTTCLLRDRRNTGYFQSFCSNAVADSRNFHQRSAGGTEQLYHQMPFTEHGHQLLAELVGIDQGSHTHQ